MVYKETFMQLYRMMAGENTKAANRSYNAKRLNRALMALKCQNYFFNFQFTNASGAAGVQMVDNTEPIREGVIIRGGSGNARTPSVSVADATLNAIQGALELQLFRSGPGRPQLAREFICDAHYLGAGQLQGQKWSLDWPIPVVIDPNEIIQIRARQSSATTAGTVYNFGLYGLAVDKRFRCDDDLLCELKSQIENTLQRPLYLNMKNDAGAGTLVFPAIGADQRVVAQTMEAPEHLLVIGFSPSWFFQLNGNFRFVTTGGPSFSRQEVNIRTFETFGGPTDGYFRFMTPYLLKKGASLGVAVTQTTTTFANQNEAEITLLCVSV